MSEETTTRSIRSLISEAKRDAQHLVQVQKELAEVEWKSTQDAATVTGGAFGAAAVMAALGGFFLLLTIAFGLYGLGLPLWAAFGIVTLVLFIVAGVAGVIGKKRSGQIKGMPLSKKELEATKQALVGGATGQEVATTAGNSPQRAA